jgi:catechol 2,3-dioxygenase-like lactoylglutathione lyase family enzyme
MNVPRCNLHHVHLFASNLDTSAAFYREMFGAEVVSDGLAAGVRNLLIRIGSGHINIYDQPPRGFGRNAVHHLGIYTEDISSLKTHMESRGFYFQTEIRDFGNLKYIMLEGPDQVLIEVFETKAAWYQGGREKGPMGNS